MTKHLLYPLNSKIWATDYNTISLYDIVSYRLQELVCYSNVIHPYIYGTARLIRVTHKYVFPVEILVEEYK